MLSYRQEVLGPLVAERDAFRANELDRILSAVKAYQAATGLETVYDSSPNSSQSFGLDPLPDGIKGQDGTSQILAILNQADGL
jgi:hypothetical protein